MEMTGTKIRTRELWLREGDQGRAWNFARVSIPSNPHTRYYQIIMESKLGSGRGGVVALDDIDLDAYHPCSNSLENGGNQIQIYCPQNIFNVDRWFFKLLNLAIL